MLPISMSIYVDDEKLLIAADCVVPNLFNHWIIETYNTQKKHFNEYSLD